MPINRALFDQGRAKYCLQCAEDAKSNGSITYSDYVSYVKKIPMMLKTNGLGLTIAFVNIKGGAYEIIKEQVNKWFQEEIGSKVFLLQPDIKLNDVIPQMNSNEYRLVTYELLSLFNWLRRYADGLK